MEYEAQRRELDARFRKTWELIISKYSLSDLHQGDVLDLVTGEVVEDNGHLRSLKQGVGGAGAGLGGLFGDEEEPELRDSGDLIQTIKGKRGGRARARGVIRRRSVGGGVVGGIIGEVIRAEEGIDRSSSSRRRSRIVMKRHTRTTIATSKVSEKGAEKETGGIAAKKLDPVKGKVKSGKPNDSAIKKNASFKGRDYSKAEKSDPKVKRSDSKAGNRESKAGKSESKARKSDSKARKSDSKARKSESKAGKRDLEPNKETMAIKKRNSGTSKSDSKAKESDKDGSDTKNSAFNENRASENFGSVTDQITNKHSKLNSEADIRVQTSVCLTEIDTGVKKSVSINETRSGTQGGDFADRTGFVANRADSINKIKPEAQATALANESGFRPQKMASFSESEAQKTVSFSEKETQEPIPASDVLVIRKARLGPGSEAERRIDHLSDKPCQKNRHMDTPTTNSRDRSSDFHQVTGSEFQHNSRSSSSRTKSTLPKSSENTASENTSKLPEEKSVIEVDETELTLDMVDVMELDEMVHQLSAQPETESQPGLKKTYQHVSKADIAGIGVYEISDDVQAIEVLKPPEANKTDEASMDTDKRTRASKGSKISQGNHGKSLKSSARLAAQERRRAKRADKTQDSDPEKLGNRESSTGKSRESQNTGRSSKKSSLGSTVEVLNQLDLADSPSKASNDRLYRLSLLERARKRLDKRLERLSLSQTSPSKTATSPDVSVISIATSHYDDSIVSEEENEAIPPPKGIIDVTDDDLEEFGEDHGDFLPRETTSQPHFSLPPALLLLPSKNLPVKRSAEVFAAYSMEVDELFKSNGLPTKKRHIHDV